MTIQRRFSPASSRSQRGAVLYVALIILILLTLIGIVGMQVATMQERMSSNYLAANQAFQRAEGGVRPRALEGRVDLRHVPPCAGRCAGAALASPGSSGSGRASSGRTIA